MNITLERNNIFIRIYYNMFFIVNEENKVIFGWSAKCGCSHVKKIIHFLKNGRIDNEIHIAKTDVNILPQNLSEYEVILFIRNTYNRLI